MADVLVDDAPHRLRRLAGVAAALLVAVVAGGAALRSTLPPPPLDVRLDGVSGTALEGDSFAQVRLALRSQQARELDEAVLSVAGTAALGRHRDSFDEQGQVTVQFELAPDCDEVSDELAPGQLELAVRDAAGDPREARLEVAADGPLGRLLRSSCQQ